MSFAPKDDRPKDMEHVMAGDAVRWVEQTDEGGRWFNFYGYAEPFPGGDAVVAVLFGHSAINSDSNRLYCVPKRQFLKQFVRA